jgi:hypothetical protein
MRPREHLSEVVVAAPTFGTAEGTPENIRLFWTGEHSLDIAGLVTRSTSVFEIQTLRPLTATHSTGTSVLDAVSKADGAMTVVNPDESIRLVFKPKALPEGKQRDLILVSNGYFTRKPELITSAQMNLPTRDDLELASPNPFSSEIALHYAVAPPGRDVTITVFDVKGRFAKTLVREFKPGGRFVTTWDGRTEQGRPLPAGVYFCRMLTEEHTSVVKLIKSD